MYRLKEQKLVHREASETLAILGNTHFPVSFLSLSWYKGIKLCILAIRCMTAHAATLTFPIFSDRLFPHGFVDWSGEQNKEWKASSSETLKKKVLFLVLVSNIFWLPCNRHIKCYIKIMYSHHVIRYSKLYLQLGLP